MGAQTEGSSEPWWGLETQRLQRLRSKMRSCSLVAARTQVLVQAFSAQAGMTEDREAAQKTAAPRPWVLVGPRSVATRTRHERAVWTSQEERHRGMVAETTAGGRGEPR